MILINVVIDPVPDGVSVYGTLSSVHVLIPPDIFSLLRVYFYYSIKAYEKENNVCPFDEFLSDLTPKMRAKVLRDLDLLEEFGNRLREPYSKHLEDGIFELRTQLASDITRSLYFFYDGDRIVITHGFTKKQMKTPPGEIKKAKAYRADWLRRHVK